MYLDPEALTIKALDAARNAGLESEVSVRGTELGFTTAERKLLRGAMEALCQEFSRIFADGVGLALEEQQAPDQATTDVSLTGGWIAPHDRDDAAAPITGEAQISDAFDSADGATRSFEAMSWPELRGAATAAGIDIIDPDSRKPRSKAVILELLGVTEGGPG